MDSRRNYLLRQCKSAPEESPTPDDEDDIEDNGVVDLVESGSPHNCSDGLPKSGDLSSRQQSASPGPRGCRSSSPAIIVRQRSHTEPSCTLQSAFQTLYNRRSTVPRDPIQPKRGSLTSLSSKHSGNSSEEEQEDELDEVPRMRQRSSTCPEKGLPSNWRQRRRRHSNRPPTPPPGTCRTMDGNTVSEKQLLQKLLREKLKIHDRDMPKVPENNLQTSLT